MFDGMPKLSESYQKCIILFHLQTFILDHHGTVIYIRHGYRTAILIQNGQIDPRIISSVAFENGSYLK